MVLCCHLLVNYGALMLKALFEHWPPANANTDEKQSTGVSQVMCKQTHAHTHMRTHTCAHTHAHTHMRIHICAYTHARTHTHMHTRRTYTHDAHTHTHDAHTHTHDAHTQRVEVIFHSQLQDRKFFSVREHTPIILAESGDCGCTLARFLCRDAANTHESKQIGTHIPPWVEEIVSKVGLI